ncbi:MAG TPA: nucleoside monophosphate kinase [Candidatus Pacearchaeota archaeon]|nr:nucleoside monophosphate kinase [Candidatus Pacearchaeota archaeon]
MNNQENPLVISIIGKSGAGKGTQVKLLQEKLGLDYVGSGDLLRKRKNINDFTGNKIASTIDNGGLAPSSIVFKLCIDEFEKIKNKGTINGIIIDGAPRKILEAKMMEEAMSWYEWSSNYKVIVIDISDDEAINRLLKRAEIEGRSDDTEEGIRKRLIWYKEEVEPVISFFKDNGKLIVINGEQSIEDVYDEILQKLEL